MSELEALLTIHGAVDRATVEHPELADVVGLYYGPYAGGGAIGWFDEFRTWTAELTHREASEILIVDAAAVTFGHRRARRNATQQPDAGPPHALDRGGGPRAATRRPRGRRRRARKCAMRSPMPPACLDLLRDDAIFGDAGMWSDLVHDRARPTGS